MKLIENEKIKVYTTNDYSMFKSLNGNREVNKIHVKRLKSSMSENSLTTIIMVNEKYEIIDGQHRFTVSKDLGLPINFIISKGYDLKEVQVLNANMKNWRTIDYIEGFCDLGYKDYIIYKDYVAKYKFSNQVAMLFLSDAYASGTNVESPAKRFKEGKFKVKDLSRAIMLADNAISIEPYYEGYLRRSFLLALYSVSKKDVFDFDEFINKLKQQPTMLKDCTNVSQYKEVIENIYNYRRREKVNLRF
jgi:hypothetical protein